VWRSVERKIADFGFCCGNRVFNSEQVVAYGASEMMSFWLENGLIDCAVVVCEGAGTVIASNGKLVQAIGARLTGIIKRPQYQKLSKKSGRMAELFLDETNALIDQFEGVKKALDLGLRRIAVTVAGFQSKVISKIRNFGANSKADISIFSVCNTCIGEADVEHIAKADLVCASGSKILREEIGKRALMQVGVTIPVYALTDKGKRLVLAYLAEFKDKMVIFRASKLPYKAESKGPRLRTQR
jgi:putative methanogenesis marker protein 8